MWYSIFSYRFSLSQSNMRPNMLNLSNISYHDHLNFPITQQNSADNMLHLQIRFYIVLALRCPKELPYVSRISKELTHFCRILSLPEKFPSVSSKELRGSTFHYFPFFLRNRRNSLFHFAANTLPDILSSKVNWTKTLHEHIFTFFGWEWTRKALNGIDNTFLGSENRFCYHFTLAGYWAFKFSKSVVFPFDGVIQWRLFTRTVRKQFFSYMRFTILLVI